MPYRKDENNILLKPTASWEINILLRLTGSEEDETEDTRKHFLLRLQRMKQWRRRAHVAQYGTLKGLENRGKGGGGRRGEE